MKFCEVMIYYDYKMSNIAKALHVTRETIKQWKKNDKVPFERQCQIEVLTDGKLKADKNV